MAKNEKQDPRVSVIFRMLPEERARLRIIALENGTTLQRMLEEYAKKLLKKHDSK